MTDNTPLLLKRLENYPDDVSILIGENGSGKSTLLNDLSSYFLENGKKVIALANSVHDKFEQKHKRFSVLRGRSGRYQSIETIKRSLSDITEDNIQRLRFANLALKYVNFSPVIGFKINELSFDYDDIIAKSDIDSLEKDLLIFLITQSSTNKFRNSSRDTQDDIVWIGVASFSLEELQQSSFLKLLSYESKLRAMNVFKNIEIFLRKGGRAISVLNASSGELSLITSIIYLATVVTENTVILIDEPENSLHPKWQKEYARTLMDIFYLYQPKIIIATHSPLVVNGAELFVKSSKIYKANNFEFVLQHKEPLNIEELFYRFFEISTPQNRFISDRVIRLLNLLSNGKTDLLAFSKSIEEIKEKAYDPKQKEVLDGIIELGAEVVISNT